MDITNFKWTRPPKDYHISDNKVEIVTDPYKIGRAHV